MTLLRHHTHREASPAAPPAAAHHDSYPVTKPPDAVHHFALRFMTEDAFKKASLFLFITSHVLFLYIKINLDDYLVVEDHYVSTELGEGH